MPHIESASKSHAPKASYSPSSHQPKVADSARATFESMLDDNAADAKAAVKDANQNTAADRTQQTPAPKAKSDTNAADNTKPADQTAPQTAAPDQTQAQPADKPVDPAVVAAQTDAAAATVATDTPADSKSDTDKPATDTTSTPDTSNALPVVPTVPAVPAVPAAPVATAVPTLTPADAQPAPTQQAEQVAAAAPVIAAVAGQQQVQKGDPTEATVATDDTGKAVAKEGNDQPAKADQAGDGDQVAAQTEQQAPVDADKAKAPHAAPSKTDLEHIARARGESADKTDATSGRGQSDKADATVAAKTDVPTQTVQPPSHPTQQTSAITTTPAATHAQTTSQTPVTVPLAAVAVTIANKAVAGAREFAIRLDPPELGRIEVKMHVDRDGNVTSRLIADRQDTLDLLKRDSSGLERALQDAGLKTSDNGLQFSLRDQSLTQQQQQNDGNGKSNTLFVQDEKLPVVDVPVQNYGRLAGRTSGLDIRV